MLAAKQKISGFGHRVYKTEDPRATHLRKMSEQLGKDAGVPKWFEMSRAIELYINADKKLNANVDFYSASTYATWASTSTSTRPSSPSAASPAGPPTSSSSSTTTASSAPAPSTSARPTPWKSALYPHGRARIIEYDGV
jgi:hypothetical protein